MIPGVFVTFDRDIEMGLFCLNAMSDLGMVEGINFHIPYQNEHAAARYRRELDPRLTYRLVKTPPQIKRTLGGLVEAAGDHQTYFFATSDRYPIRPITAQVWSGVRDYVAGTQVDSFRLIRWRERVKALSVDIGLGPDLSWSPLRTPHRTGEWHPQFLSRRLMMALLDGDPDLGLMAWHKEVVQAHKNEDLRILSPNTSLTAIEEPMLGGWATLHYAARQMQAGRWINLNRVKAKTATYTNPAVPKINDYWAGLDEPVAKLLNRKPKTTPYSVFSIGGVGSKMLLRWLYDNDANAPLSASHEHWRIPPLNVRQNQTTLYVFGDPVDTTLSFFGRRDRLHSGHGFQPHTRERPGGKAFALRGLLNSESVPDALSEEDTAVSYIAHGVDQFRIEEHLNNWLYANRPYPVLFLRYETLWRHASVLEDLLGKPAGSFPEQVMRAARSLDLPVEVREAYDALFAPHRDRLAALPDVFTMQSGRMTVIA